MRQSKDVNKSPNAVTRVSQLGLDQPARQEEDPRKRNRKLVDQVTEARTETGTSVVAIIRSQTQMVRRQPLSAGS